MLIGNGYTDKFLDEKEVRELCAKGFEQAGLKGKRVLTIIPDSTRSCPLPMMFKLFVELIGQQVEKLDFLIALGTHPPMSEENICKLVGITPDELKNKYKNHQIYNHLWDDQNGFKSIGKITAEEMNDITGGLFKEEVQIRLNKLVFDYDYLIILGPTFPHEVVGFSGGNKYLFPGIGEGEFINSFHWLGAMITNQRIIGNKYNPVRKVVDKAAEFLKIPKICFDMVVYQHKLAGLFIGTAEEAWSQGADLSDKLHIIYKAKPFKKVLGIAPEMYDEMWTAGKVMYKLEPVIADGGELIIYGPHIKEISVTHGKIIEKIGYHTRDYFLKQMDKFKGIPGGVMAHSTHVKGFGSFENGIEKPRVNVVLATGIPEEKCKQINLGYMDYRKINVDEYKDREDEGILFVPHAGEMLYRVKGKEY